MYAHASLAGLGILALICHEPWNLRLGGDNERQDGLLATGGMAW